MAANSFSERVKQLRLERKISPEECAKLLDIHRSTLVRYEKGDRFPSFQGLVRIAKLFEVSTDFLLGVSDSRKHDSQKDTRTSIPNLQQSLLQNGQIIPLSPRPILDFKKDSDLLFLQIEGQEYLPAYASGDLLVFKQNLAPQNGDVVLWSRSEKTEIRTFYQRSNGIILVGIAPYAPPEWIENWPPSQSLGILTHVIRSAKQT